MVNETLLFSKSIIHESNNKAFYLVSGRKVILNVLVVLLCKITCICVYHKFMNWFVFYGIVTSNRDVRTYM
ncbi:MAG: hypothetical protein N4A49_06220, partial [Marinifilaceae bacterium]|nr:hypothetical protein [Marinifilaceae bacterium]